MTSTNDFLDDLCRIVSVAAERMRLADNLREEALTDPLTRLPNRKALELHLGKHFDRAGREGPPGPFCTATSTTSNGRTTSTVMPGVMSSC